MANNELYYEATPSSMALYAQRVKALGASLIGGCCGNGPEHIRAIVGVSSIPLTDDERQALLEEKRQRREAVKVALARERNRRRG